MALLSALWKRGNAKQKQAADADGLPQTFRPN
jgi:hypothetical protein